MDADGQDRGGHRRGRLDRVGRRAAGGPKPHPRRDDRPRRAVRRGRRSHPSRSETLDRAGRRAGAAADLARRQRKKAWGKFSDPDGTHDYRDRDMRNLRKRQRQYRGVAKELRSRADDPTAVGDSSSRRGMPRGATSRPTSSAGSQVEGMRADVDPDYDMMRAARMQSLRLVDLPRLAAHRRRLAERRGAARPLSSTPNDRPGARAPIR